MLLSPSGAPAAAVSIGMSAAACGIGVPGSRNGGGAMGVPLEACRVASYVSPLRMQSPLSPLYDRLPGLPSLPLDPAIISAAHQVPYDLMCHLTHFIHKCIIIEPNRRNMNCLP